MAKTTGVWGIDIGQCALKAVRLELIDGRPTATAFDYIEHPKILSQPDADPDELTRESLQKFLDRNPVKKDQLAVGIPGQSGLARFVKLPPVEEKKIAEIVKFEAKQQIPFPLDEVVWDFQKIAGGESVGGFAMETEIGLFAMKRDVIARFLSHFQAVRADVHFVQMASLSLCNYTTYELLKKGGPDGRADDAPPAEGEADDTPRGKRRCVVVLDVGTDNSNLVITDGGKIIWQRPLPLGGNHFTRALTKELKLTFAKAEHLKRNAAKSPDLASILRALRPVLSEFVQEVQRSLGYFTNTHRDAHIAYMVGLGNAFRLPGLQKYMSEKLSLDVRKPARLDRFSGDAVLNDPNFSENILTFPVALGLALQGIGLARLQTNLLPDEIRVDRLIRAKKPWAAAAAACLLLGTGALALGYGSQYAAVTDPDIETAMKSSGSVVSQATAQKSEETSKKSGVDATAAEVKTIIAGNDERLNWIRLNEVLVAALPRHGDPQSGGNLTEDYQVPFWRTDEGERAKDKYRERMKVGIPLEKLFDDDKSEHLANVNVEAVTARYTDDLGMFIANADRYVTTTYNRSIAEDMLDAEREQEEGATPPRWKPVPPTGGGWVVEVRGFTYHKDELNFLRQTLIKNLQKVDYYAQATGQDMPVDRIIPGGTDPVIGKVSYVALLDFFADVNPARNQFKKINTSRIAQLILPQAGGTGELGPDGMPIGGSPGDEFSGGPEGFAGDGTGVGGAAAAPPWTPWGKTAVGLGQPGAEGGEGYPGGIPGGEEYPGGPEGTQPIVRPGFKPKPRYEFVVSFIWKEPVAGGTADAAADASVTP